MMKNFPRYVNALRFFFAALLFVTAIGKLLDNRGFAEVVATYQVFPEAVLLPLALALSLAELALAIWLLWGVHLAWAALGTVLFHAGYIAWLGLAYVRGLDIPNCGCFGVFLARPLTVWMFVEDGLLLAAALLFWRGATRADEPNMIAVIKSLREKLGLFTGVARAEGQGTASADNPPDPDESQIERGSAITDTADAAQNERPGTPANVVINPRADQEEARRRAFNQAVEHTQRRMTHPRREAS